MLPATNLQVVFHADEIYSQICPIGCFKSDWDNEFVHKRGCFYVELLSLSIWPHLCFRRSAEEAFLWKLCNTLGRQVMAGWDAYTGAGSIMATDKASHYLLIGQASESMEYIGRA